MSKLYCMQGKFKGVCAGLAYYLGIQLREVEHYVTAKTLLVRSRFRQL